MVLSTATGCVSREGRAEPSHATMAERDEEAEAEIPNFFVENDFVDEFIFTQLLTGSAIGALGITFLTFSAVRASDRDEVLEPVGGVEQCDRGAVDPALCARYREIDDEVDQTLVAGVAGVMVSLTFFAAALTAYGVVTITEASPSVAVAPFVGPGVAGLAVSGQF
jgi:hypothetical protein